MAALKTAVLRKEVQKWEKFSVCRTGRLYLNLSGPLPQSVTGLSHWSRWDPGQTGFMTSIRTWILWSLWIRENPCLKSWNICIGRSLRNRNWRSLPRMSPGISRITSCLISWKLTSVTADMNTQRHGNRHSKSCLIIPAL